MIFGCLMDARILTSVRAFYFSFSFRLSSLTNLRAYGRLSDFLMTLYTDEYDPTPIKRERER